MIAMNGGGVISTIDEAQRVAARVAARDPASYPTRTAYTQAQYGGLASGFWAGMGVEAELIRRQQTTGVATVKPYFTTPEIVQPPLAIIYSNGSLAGVEAELIRRQKAAGVATVTPIFQQEAPAPSPVTSPLATSVPNVPGIDLDFIHNLLIVMVILQFLQLFGGIMAGAAGGAAAGFIRR